MRFVNNIMSGTSPYIPKNPCVQGILSLFNEGRESESTDVTFSFVVNNDNDDRGQAEKLYAHKLISSHYHTKIINIIPLASD